MHKGPLSDHFDGKRFYNPGKTLLEKTLRDVLHWRLTSQRKRWPRFVENVARPSLPASLEAGEASLTFVNHASFLIQLPGLNILTDPVWSERTSPVQWAGPRRVRAPGIAFDDLPRIDAVLVSHNHYDHMDRDTLRRLEQTFAPHFVVALGDRAALRAWGIKRITELDWWQSAELSTSAGVQFTPTQHWSGRGLRDRFHSLWGGFMITHGEQRIYFGGDAGYSDWYREIHRRCGVSDIALLPIGAYEPRWFMAEHHMNPREAVQAHIDLQARRSVGIHYGCWQLTDEGIDDPLIALEEARRETGLDAESFTTLEVGETRLYALAAYQGKSLPL